MEVLFSAALSPQSLNKNSAALMTPPFLSKSVLKTPNTLNLCFGILPPQSSAPSPPYTNNLDQPKQLLVSSGRNKHILNSNDVAQCETIIRHLPTLWKKPQRTTHIQEDLAITLKTDEKVHLIDIVNALVILKNTIDTLPSVICRQKQGCTITLGETPGLI